MFGDDKLGAGFSYAGKEFGKLRFGLKGSNGRVDLLFNNAGIGAPSVDIDALDHYSYRLHADDRKRISENEFAIQKYLNMVNAELLELHARKQVYVGDISFHFFQVKVDMGFRNEFDLLRTKDARCLAKPANTVAPTSPNAELQKPDR
jgi:hypothetical protein